MGASRKRSRVPKIGDALRELDLVLDMLKQETDRGAALVGGAFVEQTAGELVRLNVIGRVDDDFLRERVFAPEGLAGSFSCRIAFVRAFGLSDDRTARALDVVRDIRNQAAHFLREDASFSFEAPHITDALRRCDLVPRKMLAANKKTSRRDEFTYLITEVILRMHLGAFGWQDNVTELREKRKAADARWGDQPFLDQAVEHEKRKKIAEE